MKLSRETIRLKIRNKIYIPLTAAGRKKKLLSDDFTIISNNCWGGTVYESYGMKKMSPTVGMFIMPSDFIRLAGNLKEYLEKPLVFISPDESKWRDALCHKENWGTYLIAQLGDIELHMLHYHDRETAERKWNSRVKRVNYDRLLFKFNDQNGCSLEEIKEFLALPVPNKLCFVCRREWKLSDQVIWIRQPARDSRDGVKASREPFGKSGYLDLTSYLNHLS